MNVSKPFIARPIATSLLAIALLLAGILGYRALPVAALPTVDFPTIQVSTQLPGASADTMESLITTPLERQFGLIAGLNVMTSSSSEGLSLITLQFNLEENIDIASEDVQAAINAAKGVLPTNLPYPPAYSKVNPADPPVMSLALSSDTLPLTKVNDTADTILAQKLSQITGVGRVLTEGGQRPAFRIQMNPALLSNYSLTMEDVRTSLAAANVNLPKGTFDGPLQSLSLDVNDQIEDAETYKNIIIAQNNGTVVRVRDVGDVVESLENTKVGGWVNGHTAVIIDIQRQPGANIVATVDGIKEALPQLTSSLPTGIKVDILSDRTETIRASISDVQFTLFLTIGLVILVIYLFLKNIKADVKPAFSYLFAAITAITIVVFIGKPASIFEIVLEGVIFVIAIPLLTLFYNAAQRLLGASTIPAVALPLSLIATFSIMALCGFSLDNLSLMALTIASGFVVDDAIVMIENIVRYIEKGEKPLAAAYKGAKEIGFTIISLTVSLIAVFIPLLFMTGIVGRLFREFALTLTIAVVVSAIISLTLTPMMCGRMLKQGSLKEEEEGQEKGFFGGLKRGYGRTLSWVMGKQTLTLIIAAVTLIATILLYIIIPKDFLPSQDTGQIVATLDASAATSYPEMVKLQHKVVDVIRTDNDVANVASFLGVSSTNLTPNTGHISIILKPLKKRDASADEIAVRLSKKLKDMAGADVTMQSVQDIQIGATSSRTKYQYTLTDLNPDELHEWTGKLLAKLKSEPMLTDIATDEVANGLKADIQIDRDAASRFGVQPQVIDNTLYDAFGQRQISTVYSQVNQYHVILEVSPEFQKDPSMLSSLYVKSTTGKLVPVTAFTKVTIVPASLNVAHSSEFPSTTISFNLAKGKSLGAAMDVIEQNEKDLKVPDTIVGNYSGEAAEFRTSLASEPALILAAVVVIYIVLGVLYESTIHPITILSTLPSAGVGALLALMLTGNSLSLVALIGIVLLMGIVKKNAIMMIDFALEAERDGLSPEESIYKASLLRFRPIMMTTMAALLGAIPLAIDSGMGAELRRPLGISIVGGLVLSQLLTLYTTPVIYLAMERVKVRLGGGKAVDGSRDKAGDDA